MKIGIIGAGPAGLTAAYKLASAGHQVVVFEGSPFVGGMARSLDLWGQRVDLGPHRFFSKDPRVNGLWLEIMGRDYRMVERQTRILYGGRLYDYPLSAGNALRNMGLYEAAACVMSYAKARLASPASKGNEETFEDWVISRFGRRLFEMFFKSYSEKLWGIPCNELNSDFAAQRIKSFSLAQALVAMAGLARGRHRTLADVFAYPLNGNGEVYERMARRIERAGGEVRLNTGVDRVLVDGSIAKGIALRDGSEHTFDHVITTMPLTAMVAGLPDIPDRVKSAAGALRFRNTIVVYLLVDKPDLFPDQWLYVHSPDLKMGRVTNFRNWAPDICRGRHETILALEFWSNDDETLWLEADESLIDRASKEIAATGLVDSKNIRDGKVIRVPRCYPVYSRDYKEHLEPVVDFLKTYRNLWPIGRYGSFKYNNQDHSILMGLLAAENILGQNSHDLWNVNSDDEYQESAVITESGLSTKQT